jgi:uncharacterized protein (DUF2141 family)
MSANSIRTLDASSARANSPIAINVPLRRLAWAAVFLLVLRPPVALCQVPCIGIHVEILGIRNSVGTIACALFESPAGFPADVLRSAMIVTVMKIRNTRARCDFEEVPAGVYAIAVIHDENMNGKLDTDWLGIPTEGYGFSNGARGVLGAPSFSAASFRYDGQGRAMTIRLHY